MRQKLTRLNPDSDRGFKIKMKIEEENILTLFLIAPRDVDATDKRIKELGYLNIFVKTVERKSYPSDIESKQEYNSVEKYADPHAVDYILWGKTSDKEEFIRRKKAGEIKEFIKKACPLCAAQT